LVKLWQNVLAIIAVSYLIKYNQTGFTEASLHQCQNCLVEPSKRPPTAMAVHTGQH